MSTLSPEGALERLLEDGRERAARTDAAQVRLWEALTEATRGGKRFRPALVMAAHRAFTTQTAASSQESAATVAAAVELLHTAFVVHDDVIDGDDVRRGRLNVSGTYHAAARAAGASAAEARELGRAAGILAGDLALTTAVRAIAGCGAGSEVVDRLLDLVDAALHATACGELADVRHSLHLEATTLADSLRMEEQKTSVYSFALPLQAGALLAGADTATITQLGEAGRRMGVAFQLLDDLLGVFGDPTRTGKSATSDLRAGKQTPLLVHAATTSAWPRLRELVGRELTEAELAEAQHLLDAAGSRGFVEELVETEMARARRILEELGVAEGLLDAVAAALPAATTTKEAA
ncbi:polyprenyl synthetase family protein [Nocardioides sp. BP30]|uniref:polyprenyl synthetase family protein n=1 Tax=Nocardioides sp. BP30 TaxID=3036374 RepID=UPI002468768E|nr:polyprenyl synthetase family protein [Nocardioides sp. BP30]WGL52602.1 polyprenyl synthetase family protein [Nocardioides sp. BP30]